MTTNRNAVQALWRAIYALEDDAAVLTNLASQRELGFADDRMQEARASLEAATALRDMAAGAQQRLDALDRDVGAGSTSDSPPD